MGPHVNTAKTLFGPMRYFHPIAVQLHDEPMREFRPEDYLPTLGHHTFIGGLLGWDEWAHTTKHWLGSCNNFIQ
jgi:hypothetical protein